MAKAKILVVEDEEDIREVLSDKLGRQGYRVTGSGTAEAGLALARKHKPDLIILDIALPGMDGLELCRILRAETQVPIVFLTAKTSEIDQVLGLRLGADDYITKPFSPEVLVAKIAAILHRTRLPQSHSGAMTIGDMAIDFDRHEVMVDGRHRHLGPKEFQIFKLLVDADGKVFSRDQLLEQVWGYDHDMDISTRTVDQHIARIRRKLHPEGKRITTVRKFGYKLRLR